MFSDLIRPYRPLQVQYLPWNKAEVIKDVAQNTSTLVIQKKRQQILKDMCFKTGHDTVHFDTNKHKLFYMMVDEERKFIWCSVSKVANTNWKIALGMLRNLSSAYLDKLNGGSLGIHRPSLWGKIGIKPLSSYSSKQQAYFLQNYFKFIFVRHPFARLFSAYTFLFRSKYDKHPAIRKVLKDHLPLILSKVGKPKTQESTGNVTFSDFLTYITKTTGQLADTHWRSYDEGCQPCSVPYDFIGRFETLNPDSSYVMNKISKSSGPALAFPHADRGPHSQYTEKNNILVNAFLNITDDIMNKIRKIYLNDFLLFDYDPHTFYL